MSIITLGLVIYLLYGEGEEGVPAGEELEQYQDDYTHTVEKNKDIDVTVMEELLEGTTTTIYDMRYQDLARNAIDHLIALNDYTEDSPLVIYNAFGTNSQSLYVYFKTKDPVYVEYSVHVTDTIYPDYGGYVVPAVAGLSTVHEFQIIGLTPDNNNMITLKLTDASGVTRVRRFYYNNSHKVAAHVMRIDSATGTKTLFDEETETYSTVNASEDSVLSGMYVAFPMENDLKPYIRIYDNDGVLRSEIPLEAFTAEMMLFDENGNTYFTVSPAKFVCMDRLGHVTRIYSTEDYSFTSEFCFDKGNDILMVASKNSRNSVKDVVLLFSAETGEISELVDFCELLSEYMVKCEEVDGVLNWLDINAIESFIKADPLHYNRFIVSCAAPNVIIKVRRAYNKPKIDYIIGDKENGWEDTSYKDLFFLRIGDTEKSEFEMQDNLVDIELVKYDGIRTTRHYIYVWDGNEDYDYAKKETHFSYLKRYLIDEAEEGVRLMQTDTMIASGEEGNIECYNDHYIIANSLESAFYEYDSQLNLIKKYTYKEPVVTLTEDELEYYEDNPPPDGTVLYKSVYKYDFYGYFFLEKPAPIYLTEPEEETTEETGQNSSER
ncbi:MAG: aryl-sulfate sulfotransferase [Lachnospiraceae bacterium]|nr:aryl-sulfate sulfotransferase [Lachnospiraceae bacterium]